MNDHAAYWTESTKRTPPRYQVWVVQSKRVRWCLGSTEDAEAAVQIALTDLDGPPAIVFDGLRKVLRVAESGVRGPRGPLRELGRSRWARKLLSEAEDATPLRELRVSRKLAQQEADAAGVRLEKLGKVWAVRRAQP